MGWYLLGILLALVGVAFSIAWHELGHLIPAKLFGVKCTQYMVGFGPTVWSRRKGDTEYGVKAIPLGGYVRMIGMFPPRPGDIDGQLRASSTGRFSQLADQARAESMEEIGPGDEDRVFYKLAPWKRVIVMLGGPVMNLILAVVLLTGIITIFGLPQTTPRVGGVVECAPIAYDATECEGEPPSPAAAAGLAEGDVIRSVAGQEVGSWDEASAAIRQAGAGPTTIVVERGGEMVPLTADLVLRDRPVFDQDGRSVTGEDGEPVLQSVSYLGASGTWEYVEQPLSAAPAFVGDAVVQTGRIFLTLPERLVQVADAAFGSAERDPEGPMSVVGVGRVAGEVTSGALGGLTGNAAERTVILLSLLASLNIALFVFNMIPLLPLDGGHVAGALWEATKKRWAKLWRRPDPGPVDVAKALPIAYTVAIAFIGMTLLLVYADLINPIRLGG